MAEAKRASQQGEVEVAVDMERTPMQEYGNLEFDPHVFSHDISEGFLKINDLVAISKVLELGATCNLITNVIPHSSSGTFEAEIGFKEYKTLYKSGNFYYKYENWTFYVQIGENTHGVYSVMAYCPDGEAIAWFTKTYNHYRFEQNIYTGKAFKLNPKGISYLNPKPSSYDKLVLDPKTKQTVFDQSVFFLENMKGMNGLILHGDPGTGKSYTSASIAYECLKRGITVISLYNVNASQMFLIKQFINEFCPKCLVCIEDIDSAAKSREDYETSDTLAPLLEFMDGFESNDDISCVVFATTNHLDKLDQAIGNRPCRFNRKIFFDYLSFEQTKEILGRLFNDTLNSEHLDFLEEKSKLTPSHLAEIYRTAKLMAMKDSSEEYSKYFMQACEEVLNSFTTTIGSKPIGFQTTAF